MINSELNKQIEGHHTRNNELLEILKSKGLDEENLVDAEYHFWVSEHEDAVAFAKRLFDEGFLLLVIAPVEDENKTAWNVEARRRAKIKEVISKGNTEYLAKVADNFNGLYDGWGVRV